MKIVCYNGKNSVQNMLRCHFVIDVSTRLPEYICACLYKNIRHEKCVLKREAEKYTYYYGLRPMIYMRKTQYVCTDKTYLNSKNSGIH